MYNNILRKVTSLSLLTILLLSTAAFALPNAMPAAHAQVASHPNLFVSAENSQYNNYFAGPQVIQVVVSDPNINRIDQQYGEPIVTIGGKRLRMAQGTDGNWYGYFADRNQAEIAGKTAPVGGQGLNFGYFCGPTSNAAGLRSGWTMTDTKGFTVARNPFNGALLGNASETNVAGTVNPISPFGITTVGTLNNVCTFTSNSYAANTDTASVQNVVRENKTLNGGGAGFAASTNLQAAWPVIQLYDFSGIPQTVVVDYSAAGGDQIVNLTFDRIPSNLITVTPDRTSYPENTQVFLTMNDPQLNVDPTEDDVWTWGANANNNTLYYQAFDRNANARADGITGGVGGATLMPSAPAASPAMQNLIGNLTSFNFNHNGKFTFNPTAQGVRVVDFQNFGREKLVCNSGLANQCNSGTRGTPLQVQDNGLNLAKGSEMITFAEQGGVNTGVFGDWDGARIAGIVTLSPSEESPPTGSAYPAQGSIRGQSATFKYNDISGSIVGGFAFGSITMTATNGTWASGQRIPVTLTDMDQNRNSKLTEHLNDYDSNVLRISTMKLGTPFSLNAGCPTCLTGASDPTSLSPNFNLVAGGHIGTAGNGLIQLTPPAPGDTTHVVPGVSFAGFTSFTSLTSATDPDLGVDEQFSNRVLPAFSGPTALLTLQSGGGILVDTGGTMQQLLNTINDPRGGNAAGGANPVTRFHGFNFLNFDLRSFTSLNGATGTPISSVNIYLIHGPANNVRNPVTGATTFYNLVGGAAPSLANLGNGVVGFSLVNDTNLEDFVNLNGTQPVPANLLASHGETAFANDFYTPGVIDSGSVVNGRIFQAATQSPNDVVGFLYVFTIPGVGNTLTLPNFPIGGGASETTGIPMVTDFFSIGIVGDGTDNTQRINNGVYRWELEETGDNTGVFTGTTQFLMLNQVNILDPATYSQLRTINHDVLFPAIQDMLQSEARAPQITYFDLGADGVNVQVSAQQDIPTHSGTVSFDQKTYKVGDTVTVTVNDPDLNTNNDLVVIYNTVAPATGGAPIDPATDTVGKSGLGLYSNGQAIGRMLDIQFGQQDIRWTNTVIPGIAGTATCPTFTGGLTPLGAPGGFAATGFTLVETAAGSGIFTGTFEIPDQICQNLSGTIQGVVANGQNMKVNYVDFRDESGKLVEISDNAGIRGNTGSVKLDKSVYPVPFGTVGATAGTASFNPATVQGKASQSGVFPLHRDVSGTGLISTNVLPQGKVLVHTRVNDPDYTTAATGTNFINVGVMGTLVGTQTSLTHGPVAFQISRSGQSVLLATAGGPTKTPGHIIDIGAAQLPPQNSPTWNSVPDLGPMQEITPGAGIFQTDLPIELTDGPAPVAGNNDCPQVDNWDQTISGGSGFSNLIQNRILVVANTQNGVTANPTVMNYCVRQGDVLTVTYFDQSDSSGKPQTVTDSATFDLRNGVLQSDKSVYIIGSDMILTLVEPDFNLDSQQAETLPLDLIEWDSHAFKGTMGQLGGQQAAFDAKPSTFVETGKDTGIFQSVIKIPKQLGTTQLERGEQINLEYTDWGPAGAKTVGSNSQDIELTIYTSNFGATVELDQKVYTWTDRVYITVVAPDHNFDPNLIDTIGNNGGEDNVIVSTRGHQIYYTLTETGVDTGIFTGYVILTGDANLKGVGGVDGGNPGQNPTGNIGNLAGTCSASTQCGPTDGFLPAEDSDGVSVSFEFTRDQTVTGSALIRWNIGEISWLQSSYPANGQGVLQIVDPDMNLNPKAIDKFDTNVWSDSDSGGIKLTMTETGQDTGIFQGTVYFTTNFGSSGNRLHVSEGDTVTGEYKDRTLPPPYTPSDQLRLTATTFIGTVVPPLERAPATNPRIVDSFGNAITGNVKVGQQIQVTADLANGQNTDQPFAYLVQIQDGNGVTVSLSWITGTLSAGQSLNPAQSWTPSAAGTYTAQIFVWQSIDNPNALSPPLSTTITVQ